MQKSCLILPKSLLTGLRVTRRGLRLALPKCVFFLLPFFVAFFPPLGLPFASPRPPRTSKILPKISPKASSNRLYAGYRFCSNFSSIFGRSWKSRTLDFAHPYSTLATFLHFYLSAVGSPLGSVVASKNHPKIDEKSTPSVKKRHPKRTSKMTSNFDGIFLNLGCIFASKRRPKL